MNIQIPDTIAEALQANCPVAIGVSGGKDSCAVAIAVHRYFQEIKHIGPKILIHSDLGSVEWKDSLPTCERLGLHIGWPLTVVRRNAGGMLERWKQRWSNNVDRWLNLECVKLILPWSTPSMRFCTSELKADIISSELKKQFPRQKILSVTGIRADESPNRAKAPICKLNPKMQRKDGTEGWDWNPIHAWSTPYVYEYLKDAGFELHEAYRVYGATRVSCVCCIMSSQHDLLAGIQCESNAEIYRAMCALELDSTFSFQGGKWLADVAPHVLFDSDRGRVARAKELSRQREEQESRIPKHLHYTKGWPTCMPTDNEAAMIATVRTTLAVLMKWEKRAKYLTSQDVMGRYAELMQMNAEKEGKSK